MSNQENHHDKAPEPEGPDPTIPRRRYSYTYSLSSSSSSSDDNVEENESTDTSGVVKGSAIANLDSSNSPRSFSPVPLQQLTPVPPPSLSSKTDRSTAIEETVLDIDDSKPNCECTDTSTTWDSEPPPSGECNDRDSSNHPTTHQNGVVYGNDDGPATNHVQEIMMDHSSYSSWYSRMSSPNNNDGDDDNQGAKLACCSLPWFCRRRYWRQNRGQWRSFFRFCNNRQGRLASLLTIGIAVFLLTGTLLGLFPFSQRIKTVSGSIKTRPPHSNTTVGVYYYPWHSDNFHLNQGYLREQLKPRQEPTLGQYDDTEAATIGQHLEWSRKANIRLWVCSWWGPDSREDTTLLNHVLKHPDLTLYNDEGNDEGGDGTNKEPSKHYISLFYETLGRIKESEGYSTHRVADDITHMCKIGYWKHPNYFRINGRPTLFVYLSRKLDELGLLQEVLTIMKEASAAAGCGEDVFVVGDHVYGKAPLSNPLGWMDSENVFISSEGGVQEVVDNGGRDVSLGGLDAITNYDVYGSMGSDGLYAGQARVDLYYQRQSKWRDWVHQTCPNCGFVPAVAPGYNDLGVRPENQNRPVSRRLTEESPEGSLFQAALKQAVSLVDSNVQNLLMVNSFNEWHEDTQIEPAKAVKASQTGVVEATTLPNSVTNGLEYQGYGELYLKLLREATAINGTSISSYYVNY